jgi:hypothetical protein
MKYLADALINKKKFAEARKLLTESLLIYPEESMFKRLDYVKTSMDGGHLNRKWILRIARINQVEPHVLRTDFFEDALHFQHYTDGGLQVKDNYSVKGIKVEPNNEALSPYLEIESWRRMLKATEGQDIPALEYARFMEERGMLEPYVFISLFSIEFYDQYLHFIENNRPLAEKYIEDYLMGA